MLHLLRPFWSALVRGLALGAAVGDRRIGQRALGDLFKRLLQDRAGRHEIERAGYGHERSNDHKMYEFGDPLHLDVARTLKNAVMRGGSGGAGHWGALASGGKTMPPRRSNMP